MDMSNDKTVAERPHGVHQNVAGNRLNDILYELGTVAFDALPFFIRTDTFIGDRLSTEAVLPDSGFYIGKLPAGWEGDEE